MLDRFDVYGLPTVTKVDGIENEVRTLDHITPGKFAGASRDSDARTRYVVVGGVERPVLVGGLHIPIDAPLPAIGWEYVLAATGPATDRALLGRRFRVVGVPAKSYATARRLDVVEVD